MAQCALRTCEICVSGPGTEYCLECEQYFCENCKSLHKRQKATRYHEFQKGSKAVQEVKQKCNKHNEDRIFFCENCDQSVCVKCVTGKHKGHRVSDVEESIFSLKQTISKDISTKLEAIKTNLRQKEQCLQTFDQNVKSVIRQTREEGTKLKAMIDTCIQKMIESLERKRSSEKEQLEKTQSDSKKLLHKIKKLEEKEKKLQKSSGDGTLLLKKIKNLQKEILDIRVSAIPSITSVIYTTRSASEKDIVNLLGEYKFGKIYSITNTSKKEKIQMEELIDDEEIEEDESTETEDDDDQDTENEEDEETADVEDNLKEEEKRKGGRDRLFKTICNFNGDDDGDLSFKAGEVLAIIQTRVDGWWRAKNQKGETGFVPSTFLSRL